MPTFAEALTQARQLFQAGDLPRAEFVYKRLIEAAPQAVEPWHELGLLNLRAGQPAQAVECLRRAIALDPNSASYHGNLGAAYRALKQPAEAIASFERALQLAPPTAELYNNLALALKDAGRREQALATFDAALGLRPDYANGHFNRANLLVEMKRLDEAIEGYRRAIELAPHDAGAVCKLGMAYCDYGQLDAALASFDRALEIQPYYPEARRNRAFIWLAQGDFRRGWPEAEWRLECEDSGKWPFPQPRWAGAPLEGRTLLVYAEQGLGDTLQFIRYVPLAEQSGGRVLVQTQKALMPLLAQSGFDRWLVEPGADVPFDLQSPLMSLAGLLRKNGEPYWERPYLAADPQRVAQWQRRMHEIGGFKVGIVWAGNALMPADPYRTVDLAEFAPLAQIPGVRLISLQKGRGSEQIAQLAGRLDVVDLDAELDTAGGAFLDTAAVMQHLDLVITVDTSTAHLAGGLGVNTWVALSFASDWRWGIAANHSAWYPTLRLFRQSQFDRWPPVFAAMADELGPLVAAKLR